MFLRLAFLQWIWCLFFFFPAKAQTVNTETEKKLNHIKAICKEIDLGRNYKPVKKDIEGQSTEGGEQKQYYSNGKLIKIIADYYGETGELKEEYYFKDGKLIFMRAKEITYNKPIYQNNSRPASSKTNRFYFEQEKLISWVKPAGTTASPASYAAKEKEIMAGLTILK